MRLIKKILVANLLIIGLAFIPYKVALAISCTIGATGVDFGNYNVFSSAPDDSTGSITYNCTGIGNKTITIYLSKGSSSAFTTRTMKLSSNVLNYNLYTTAARSNTAIWGDSTAGTSIYGPLKPLARNQTVTVYGRIPAGQDAAVGAYSDSIIATINF